MSFSVPVSRYRARSSGFTCRFGAGYVRCNGDATLYMRISLGGVPLVGGGMTFRQAVPEPRRGLGSGTAQLTIITGASFRGECAAALTSPGRTPSLPGSAAGGEGNMSPPQTDSIDVTSERCPKCDLIVGQCTHARVTPRPTLTGEQGLVLVSPSRIAHLPGCSHNDESALSGWGEIRGIPNAWVRLGNGEKLETNSGAVNRPVSRRCRDCVDR